MEVIKALPTNEGNGNTSYANNSLIQHKMIEMTIATTKQAITNLYCSKFPDNLHIADLGCASGQNTFLVVSELIKTVDTIRIKLGHDKSPEFQVYFNDLPGNDFNSIFRSLPEFQENLKKEMGPGYGPCFFSGVPGSFYKRLFATNSIHFIHSSFSLHWLSQAPELVEINKGNIYMSSTSPPSVLKAYYEQFQKDFSQFLEYRAQEMVTGGRMVLLLHGRRSDDPSSKECCYIWELLAKALNQMVSEGLIEEEKLDSFNIPRYAPSPKEVKYEVEKEGSFAIDLVEISEFNCNAYDDELRPSDECKDGGFNVAKCVRATAEPLLVSQFGEAIIDEVFRRYKEILADCMAKEPFKIFSMIVSMTKKG